MKNCDIAVIGGGGARLAVVRQAVRVVHSAAQQFQLKAISRQSTEPGL